MAKFLKLALWKANGLTQHTEELQTVITIHNIDILIYCVGRRLIPLAISAFIFYPTASVV
jgi:hypothetical protein